MITIIIFDMVSKKNRVTPYLYSGNYPAPEPESNSPPGSVIPIYYPINGEPQFVMFRAASGSARAGLLEFPGGCNDEKDFSVLQTAARECREETCEYLDITVPRDLSGTPWRKIWQGYCFYISVPRMTDRDFQKNLEIERNDRNDKYHLEMDKLVLIPVSELLDIEYPKKNTKVTTSRGVEYDVWRLSAVVAWNAGIKNKISGLSIIDELRAASRL